MKGNEARVVFFLQPVDQFKDGEVAKVGNPFWSYFGLRYLLLLGLILALGLLAYVLVQIDHEPLVSTTVAPMTTATARTTVTTTSTTTTVDRNTTTLSPSPTIPPGYQKQSVHVIYVIDDCFYTPVIFKYTLASHKKQTKETHNIFHITSGF